MTPRVDPRIAHTRNVVLAAAAQELTNVGFERVSIDAIAERSGVARSTIYRNWPDRNVLLAEAFRVLCDTGPADMPAADSLGGDLTNLGRVLTRQLLSEDWNATVPSLISSATHDDAMVDLLAGFSAERASESAVLLDRAIARGATIERRRFERAMERFVAPFFFRRLISRLPLDEDFIEAQVTATLEELGQRREGT